MNSKFILTSFSSCASLLLLASCGGGSSGDGTPSAGDELDLSTYVAIGDSLTAGFADNTVYLDGQINS